MSNTPKPDPSSSSADALVARLALQHASHERIVASWLPPLTDAQLDSEKKAQREREEEEKEEEEFRAVPETLGLGATPPTAGRDEGVLTGTQGVSDEERLRRLLQGKSGRDRSGLGARRPVQRGKGVLGGTQRGGSGSASASPAERMRRLVQDGIVERAPGVRSGVTRDVGEKTKYVVATREPVEDEDEDLGRSALGGSVRRKADTANDVQDNSGDIKEDQSGNATNDWTGGRKSSKRKKSYLDEVLEEKARKRKKKKKTKAVALSTEG